MLSLDSSGVKLAPVKLLPLRPRAPKKRIGNEAAAPSSLGDTFIPLRKAARLHPEVPRHGVKQIGCDPLHINSAKTLPYGLAENITTDSPLRKTWAASPHHDAPADGDGLIGGEVVAYQARWCNVTQKPAGSRACLAVFMAYHCVPLDGFNPGWRERM
jgi:hypothetical protein